MLPFSRRFAVPILAGLPPRITLPTDWPLCRAVGLSQARSLFGAFGNLSSLTLNNANPIDPRAFLWRLINSVATIYHAKEQIPQRPREPESNDDKLPVIGDELCQDHRRQQRCNVVEHND